MLTFNISSTWADCTDQDCDFTATIDQPDAVCECDGTNNTRQETYSTMLPDLVVTDIDFTNVACSNDAFSGTVDVTVRNQGHGSATGFQVSLSSVCGITFTNATVGASLSNGQSTTATMTIAGSWSNCGICSCDFTAIVDATNAICECNGANNTRTETYTNALPDLMVNSITPSVTADNNGNLAGTVTVNVGNQGCSDTSNVTVRLTSDCGITFTDQTVNLTQGSTADVAFSFTPECSACVFTATIDPDNTICECSSGNNAAASLSFQLNQEIDVSQGGSSFGSGSWFEFGNHNPGSQTDITMTVSNSGTSTLSISLPVRIEGGDAGDFSIQQQPASAVAASGSTTTVIRFTPSSAGVKTTQLLIPNNDCDESLYIINLRGYGNPTISGTIADQGGNPVNNATVTFSHDGHVETTDIAGNFSYIVTYNTSTVITPTHPGYSGWSPADITINTITADQTGQDFTCTINTYTVSGTITDTGTNPLGGVTITFSYDGHTEITDGAGFYSYSLDYDTTTTITPTHPGYNGWSPNTIILNNISSDQNNLDFQGLINVYTISGTITDGNGPMENVSVTFTHDGGIAVTNGAGFYSYVVNYDTDTTVIPNKPLHTFQPADYTFTEIGADLVDRDFHGSFFSYILYASSGPNGSIKPSGNVSVTHGESEAFSFSPDKGFVVEDVLVDNESQGPQDSLTINNITQPHTIRVTFTEGMKPVIDDFTADQTAGRTPLAVNFSASAHDPDGGTIVSYVWSGTGASTFSVETTDPSYSHTIQHSGTCTVTLTITDNDGETVSSEPLTIYTYPPASVTVPIPFSIPKTKDENGSDSFQVDSFMVNNWNESAAVVLSAKNESGAVVSEQLITLSPLAKSKVSLDGFDEVTYDYVTIESDQPLIIFSEVSSGTSIRMASLLADSAASRLYINHVAEQQNKWDSLAWLSNGMPNTPSLSFTLTMAGLTFALEPERSTMYNLEPHLPNPVAVADAWGIYTVSDSGPLSEDEYLSGFEMFVRIGSDGAAVELVSEPSNVLYIPHIPAEGETFWTGFTFLNPADVAVSATVTLYDGAGSSVGTWTMNVPAQTKAKGVINALFPGSGAASWGMVEANGDGLMGIEIFGTTTEGICGFSLTGNALTEGVLPMVDAEDSLWTGIALANPNKSATEVQLQLIGGDGTVKELSSASIPPLSRFKATVSKLFPQAAVEHTDFIRFISVQKIIAVEVSGDLDRSWMKALGAKK